MILLQHLILFVSLSSPESYISSSVYMPNIEKYCN